MTRAPYIESGDAKLCTGCSACAHTCPTGAISMCEDACSFGYPGLDEGRCVGCGKCEQVCHMVASEDLKAKARARAYGAYVKNHSQLMQSASGGMATAIALKVVDSGGVAYCCIASHGKVRHERCLTSDSIERSRGSKYVQSDISGAIPQIAADIESGVQVVFIGTPCQCAALRLLFGSRDSLLLVDLACEGVPSQRMYADFLDSIGAVDFRFRDKRRAGWSTDHPVALEASGSSIKRSRLSNSRWYYGLFKRGLTLRDCCYTCPYACMERIGDITVGDFWGVELAALGYTSSELHDGISCVLISTERGSQLLKSLDREVDLRPTTPAAVAQSNGCLRRPTPLNSEAHKRIMRSYAMYGVGGLPLSGIESTGFRAGYSISSVLPFPVQSNLFSSA